LSSAQQASLLTHSPSQSNSNSNSNSNWVTPKKQENKVGLFRQWWFVMRNEVT
ncbi:hypothetical protein MKW98_031742, partial [Papaver atlanticum]